MKYFLFEKFNSFTAQAEMDFHLRLTDSLPATKPDSASRGFSKKNPVIWGWAEYGFWTMTHTEARFYENDGTIHVLSTKYDDLYVANYRLLTTKLTVRHLHLTETDSFEIKNEAHINLKQGDKVYYAKFETPEREIGWPMTACLLTEKVAYDTAFHKEVIDFMFDVYTGLKEAGGLCPAKFTPNYIFRDSKGWYLGILKDFSVSFLESVTTALGEKTRRADHLYNSEEIFNYGESRWQTLMT